MKTFRRWLQSSGVKRLVTATLFQPGSVRTVLLGPCRGMRYRIFPGYGHAYLYGGWERKSMNLMSQYAKPGNVAYDLGANYGMHTLLLAKLVGPSGCVHAFEPHPDILPALNEQLSLNDLHNVKPVPAAVGDKVGTARFDRAHHCGAGHLVSETTRISGTIFDVEITTLDKYVFEDGNAPPQFVKIDIEGAESAALRGGREVLARYRPIFLIELHNPTEDRAVGQTLKSFGYSAIRVEDGQTVKNMESGWPDPDGMSGTVLALP